jgi:hypothetical protein
MFKKIKRKLFKSVKACEKKAQKTLGKAINTARGAAIVTKTQTGIKGFVNTVCALAKATYLNVKAVSTSYVGKTFYVLAAILQTAAMGPLGLVVGPLAALVGFTIGGLFNSLVDYIEALYKLRKIEGEALAAFLKINEEIAAVAKEAAEEIKPETVEVKEVSVEDVKIEGGVTA